MRSSATIIMKDFLYFIYEVRRVGITELTFIRNSAEISIKEILKYFSPIKKIQNCNQCTELQKVSFVVFKALKKIVLFYPFHST